MTSLTVTALINSMTSSDFPPNDVYAVQQTSHLYCSSIYGSEIDYTGNANDDTFLVPEGDHAMSISMLGSAILIEGRRVLKLRDENVIPRTIEKLFTEEMRNLLLTADETDEDSVSEGVMWENTPPVDGWQQY